MKGKVVSWKSDRQFGFIQCDELKRRIFFHVSQFNSGTPELNQLVEFEVAPDLKGHPEKAVNIVVSAVAGVNAGANALAGGAR
jgi:cold shock CspA family protein